MNNNLWVWGYVLDKVPGPMMFVDRDTHCSLETGAAYLGADNVVFMDSTTSLANLNDDLFQYVSGCKQVICGLEHGRYAETAAAVSEFSLTHPNVIGAIVDDFRCIGGPSDDMQPSELREVYQALKSKNPALQLYLVRYSHQDQRELVPFLDYFDVINYWVWVSSDHYWRSQYQEDVRYLRKLYGKPLLQGVFMHNYGEHTDAPIPMEMLELQVEKITEQLLLQRLSGWVILQNGWFCNRNHRPQVQWLKAYLDWFYGTLTVRK
jgi:hypothetical protein